MCLGHVQKRFLGQIKFVKLFVKTPTTFMILTSTYHIRFGWLGIGNVIHYRCIQVRCMKRETNQQSHMLLWPKMVSNTRSLEQHRNNLGSVRTGSNRFCKILSSSELQTRPSVQFGHWPELSNRTWVWFCQVQVRT